MKTQPKQKSKHAKHSLTEVASLLVCLFMIVSLSACNIEAPPADITDAATTTAPATDAPVFTDDLGSLLYLGEDGYVHIKGSDNIRLPAKRLDFTIKNSEEELTMSLYSQFVTTAEAAIIPLYFGISHTKNNAWVEGGKLYVKFGATDKTAEAPNEYYDSELGKKVSFTAIDYAYVSGAEAHLISNDAKTSRGYIISTFDGGESFNISAFDQAICCVYYTNSLEGTAVTYGGANMGSKTAHFYTTADGGKTFTLKSRTPDYVSATRPYCAYINGKVYFSVEGKHPELNSQLEKYGYLGYTWMLPYFDGNIGVLCAKVEISPTNTDNTSESLVAYTYFITGDGGKTWTEYFAEQVDPTQGKLVHNYYPWER